MFIAALFLITKTWKQPMNNKLWHIQTMEYYSVLKRNELSSHEKTQLLQMDKEIKGNEDKE